jgi:hypothetical protein
MIHATWGVALQKYARTFGLVFLAATIVVPTAIPVAAQQRVEFPKDGNGLLDVCTVMIDVADATNPFPQIDQSVAWPLFPGQLFQYASPSANSNSKKSAFYVEDSRLTIHDHVEPCQDAVFLAILLSALDLWEADQRENAYLLPSWCFRLQNKLV